MGFFGIIVYRLVAPIVHLAADIGPLILVTVDLDSAGYKVVGYLTPDPKTGRYRSVGHFPTFEQVAEGR